MLGGRFGHLGAAGVAGSGGSPPPPPWDPTQLSGLVAYYNAENIIQATNTVLQWPDLGPHTFALNPTGTAPTWSASSFNGGAGVTWNGDTGGNSLVSEIAAAFPALSSLSITVLFALNPINDAAWIRTIGLMASGDTSDYQTIGSLGLGQHSSDNPGGELFYDGYVNDDAWSTGTDPTCWILNGTNGDPWQPYVNFSPVTTGAGPQAAAIGGANTTIGLGPAGVGSAGGTLNTGVLTIGTAIITSNPLTSTDMTNLKAWMNTHWKTSF